MRSLRSGAGTAKDGTSSVSRAIRARRRRMQHPMSESLLHANGEKRHLRWTSCVRVAFALLGDSATAHQAGTRRNATLPATTVAIAAPWNARPSNGELRDLLGESLTLYFHSCVVEKIVTSAGWPAASFRSIPSTRAGPVVNNSTMRISEIFPV